MKIIVSISMSILFFFQGISVDMDVCEPIQKISSFITHYQDHKVYGDSFYEYVLEDYFDNEVNNKGHHNNSDKENMPVHSHQQYYHPVVFIANTSIAVFNLLKFEEKKQFNSYTFNFNSIFLESLFQPPQV